MMVISDFRVTRKSEIEERLEAAVNAAQSHANGDRSFGVLVTRHSYGHFSVALSTDVPFGLIREHDEA